MITIKLPGFEDLNPEDTFHYEINVLSKNF